MEARPLSQSGRDREREGERGGPHERERRKKERKEEGGATVVYSLPYGTPHTHTHSLTYTHTAVQHQALNQQVASIEPSAPGSWMYALETHLFTVNPLCEPNKWEAGPEHVSQFAL